MAQNAPELKENANMILQTVGSVLEVALLIGLLWALLYPARLLWTRQVKSPGQTALAVLWLVGLGLVWFLLFGHVQTGRWLWQ
jgi:hypothetical protein